MLSIFKKDEILNHQNDIQCQWSSANLWCLYGMYTCVHVQCIFAVASTIYEQDYKNDHKI